MLRWAETMCRPTVSVIIVNWNHGRLIGACLAALQAQEGVAFDITVVDNGSRDGSPQWIARAYPDVYLWTFPDNRGFSHALNAGIAQTQGAFVLSLNPDVTVRAGFLHVLAQAAEREPRVGMVAPKLLRADAPTRLDSSGLFIDRRRRPYDRGQGEVDGGHYDQRTHIFGACGAAALYRRAMLEDVALNGEYFDEDFFAYYEDADLAWRAQARGWQCRYAPGAVATHVRGWGDTLRKGDAPVKDAAGPRLAWRNRYLMTLKNDAWRYVWRDLPWILGAEAPRIAYAAVKMPRALLGLWDLRQAGPIALRKRRLLRARQTVADAVLRRWFVTVDGEDV